MNPNTPRLTWIPPFVEEALWFGDPPNKKNGFHAKLQSMPSPCTGKGVFFREHGNADSTVSLRQSETQKAPGRKKNGGFFLGDQGLVLEGRVAEPKEPIHRAQSIEEMNADLLPPVGPKSLSQETASHLLS